MYKRQTLSSLAQDLALSDSGSEDDVVDLFAMDEEVEAYFDDTVLRPPGDRVWRHSPTLIIPTGRRLRVNKRTTKYSGISFTRTHALGTTETTTHSNAPASVEADTTDGDTAALGSTGWAARAFIGDGTIGHFLIDSGSNFSSLSLIHI